MYAVQAEWKHFSSGDRKAEGRLLHAANPSGDLIVYVPGFPGGGATLYENHFADFMREHEYSQIVLRHNGTRLNGPFSDEFLNREKYPKAVPFHDGDYIGKETSSIAEWLLEPKTVLEDIGGEYTNITLVGHSFGCLSVLYSLVLMAEEGNRLLERVGSSILLAPTVGLMRDHADDVMDTVWTPEFLSSSQIWEKIELNGIDAVRSDLLSAYQGLSERVAENLTSVRKVFVHAERDEYLKHEDVEEFMMACGGNSQMVIDKFDRHDPRTGYDAHDMPNFPQQSFLDLVRGAIDMFEGVRSSDGFFE